MASSTHKPRRKNKRGDTPISDHGGSSTTTTTVSKPNSHTRTPAFPLQAFFWPTKTTSQWAVLPVVLLIVGLFRWGAGLYGYSGMWLHAEHPFDTNIHSQAIKRLRCTATSRLSDIGWRSHATCPSPSGTFTISNTGVSTTLL